MAGSSSTAMMRKPLRVAMVVELALAGDLAAVFPCHGCAHGVGYRLEEAEGQGRYVLTTYVVERRHATEFDRCKIVNRGAAPRDHHVVSGPR
jgi:hypothetical protein